MRVDVLLAMLLWDREVWVQRVSIERLFFVSWCSSMVIWVVVWLVYHVLFDLNAEGDGLAGGGGRSGGIERSGR